MKAKRSALPTLLTLLALAACGGAEEGPEASAEAEGEATPLVAGGGEVNVYSHRHYDTDQELFDRFEEETGITVNVVTASADELITRLEQEGAQSPADVLVTVDAGRLERAVGRDLLVPVTTPTLASHVPGMLHHPEGYWYGLTQRARIIAYARDRVDPSELSTYEDLADPKWEDRILIRSSSNIYNQSLLASIIAHNGLEDAANWARGIVVNMAREPQGGDRDQVKAVAAGVGDVAVVNTYYLGLLFNSDDPDERALQDQIGVFFPNQDGRGAHVNVSGAGVTAHAPNPDNAVRLLEFLTGEEAQRTYARANYEYPVNPEVEWSGTLREWGDFKVDTLNLSLLGEMNESAVRVFDRVGWR